MKRIRRRYFWGAVALLLVALGAGVYTFSGVLLNDLLRPRLVALAAERLAAEVAADRLTWRKGVLQIDNLQLRKPDRYLLQVPRLRLELRLSDLFHRRLSAVEIDSPTLRLQPSTQAFSPVGGFSAPPPVNIGRLVLRNGRIDYVLSKRSLTLRQVEVEIDGGEAYRFFLRAKLGAEEAIPLHLAGRADWLKGLQLKLERCEWAGRSLLTAPLTLTMPAAGGVAGGGRLHLERFDRAAFEQFRKGLQLPALLPDEVGFVLRDAQLDWRLAEGGGQLALRLAEARISSHELDLPLANLDLDLTVSGHQWQGKGRFLLAGDNPAELAGRWADGLLQGRLELQVAEPGRLKQQLLGGSLLQVAGAVGMTAEFALAKGAGRVQFDLQGQDKGRRSSAYLLNLAPLRLSGTVRFAADGVSGLARLKQDDRELLTVSGRPDRLELKLLPSTWSRWRSLLGAGLRPQALQEVSGLAGTAVLERQTAEAWTVTARIGSRRVTLADGLRLERLSGRLRLSGTSLAAWNGDFSLAGQQLKRAGLVLDGLSGKGRLRYQKRRLSVSKLSGTAQLAGPGQLSGKLAVAGSGFWRAGRWQASLASLQLQELEWLSVDGLKGLVGGRVDLHGQLNGGPGRPLGLDVQADLAASEGLWGAYYAELADLPVHLVARLRWRPASGQLLAEDWAARLANIGTVRGSARLSRQALRLSGNVRIPELAGPSTDLLTRLLGQSRPKLAEAALTGGLQVDFDLHKDAGWRLRGELRPQQLGLELPAADLVLRGLSGRLPFDLAFAGAEPTAKAAPVSGELRFTELRLGPARLAAAPLSLAAATNRLTVQNPLRLEVAKGQVAIDELQFGRVAEGLLVTGGFTIDHIELQRLTEDFGLAPMKGRLDADLGRIHYRGGLLRSEGEARIDAFGGRLRIGRIGLDISNLAYPQLTADIDFEGIDLYQLTQTFSFGAMNGIVDGYVHDLRLFGTTPSRFTALVESRLKGRRNISVKALNNLTILSQGGLSAALSRGIYRFIDFYRYRKIGIACELERDVFHLRGTAYSGSTRYLVHGGVLPPKIDIIAPPSTISFSEMLKRLQRIERAD